MVRKISEKNFRSAYHSNSGSCAIWEIRHENETSLNPHFMRGMNFNGNLWIFMNFERALRVCLFLNTFLERSFEFVKCLVCQLCFCTLDFVWIPFSVQVLNSKFFQYFKASDTYKRRQKPHTNHFKKVYFPSFWSKSVWFLDQNSRQNFYLSIELALTLPYLWNKFEFTTQGSMDTRRSIQIGKVLIDTWRLAFISE